MTMQPSHRTTNAPESAWLNNDDRVLFDNARAALEAIKKTFEMWIVIGEAVVRARTVANEHGGRFSFQRLMEQQRLNEIAGDKASISRLETVMANLKEVQEWRSTLTPRQRIDWAAPNTVFKRCPIFTRTRGGKAAPAKSPIAKRDEIIRDLKERSIRDAKTIADLKQKLGDGGSLFDLRRDSAKDIASAIINSVSPGRWAEIVKHGNALMKTKKIPAG